VPPKSRRDGRTQIKPNQVRELLDAQYRNFWVAVEAAAQAADFWPPPWTLPHHQQPAMQGLHLDEITHRVYVNGREVYLSPVEFRLLACFYHHRGQVVSREDAFVAATGESSYGQSTRTVDVHLGRMRQKLEADPAHPRLITTVRGFGFRLEPPDE